MTNIADRTSSWQDDDCTYNARFTDSLNEVGVNKMKSVRVRSETGVQDGIAEIFIISSVESCPNIEVRTATVMVSPLCID